MEIPGHHTQEQVLKAYAKAPGILAELTAMGCNLPYFELFIDGSGVLWLGNIAPPEAYKRACELVRSNRRALRMEHGVGIEFCCGLVDHEEDV